MLWSVGVLYDMPWSKVFAYFAPITTRTKTYKCISVNERLMIHVYRVVVQSVYSRTIINRYTDWANSILSVSHRMGTITQQLSWECTNLDKMTKFSFNLSKIWLQINKNDDVSSFLIIDEARWKHFEYFPVLNLDAVIDPMSHRTLIVIGILSLCD